jgi:hypothetical protein
MFFVRHNARLITWVKHCLAAFHCYFELTVAGVAPEGATLLGGTDAVQFGVIMLKISRGTGQLRINYWTGYWTASGN